MARVRPISAGHVWTGVERASLTIPAGAFIARHPGRGAEPIEMGLADTFVRFNQARFADYDCIVKAGIFNNQVSVRIRTGNSIGALPLLSPNSGKAELGLCIAPKAGWAGLGSLLNDTDNLVQPQLPRLGTLPKADAQTPTWVVSGVVLMRLESFIAQLAKAFFPLIKQSTQFSGSVVWDAYIQKGLAIGRPDLLTLRQSVFLHLPEILALIHATANLHLQALARHGLRFATLLRRFERLRAVTAQTTPSWAALDILIPDVQDKIALEAFEAMRWTRDNSGLGGLQTQKGLAWKLNMEQTFEAWVSAVLSRLAKLKGTQAKIGSLNQTVKPIFWQQQTRTQGGFIPDAEFTVEGCAVLADAKYKGHWEVFHTGWHNARADVKESHRQDLLQIVAYAATHAHARKVCLLVYPCSKEEWFAMEENQGKSAFLSAQIAPASQTGVELVLTAIPFGVSPDRIAKLWHTLLFPDT